MIGELAQGSVTSQSIIPAIYIDVVDVYLELVLASLSGWAWVKEIDCENLCIQ
jgi:hypothetical protein